MYIDETGNVGIGTTSPGGLLHLASATDDVTSIIDAGADRYPGISFRELGVQKWSLWNDASDDSLRFWTSGTGGISVAVASSGNVGIGTTSPQGILSISHSQFDGSGSGDYGIYFQNNLSGGFGHAAIYSEGVSGYNGSLVFATDGDSTINYNATEKMRITSAGNVGIGTTSPGAKLDVSGTAMISGNTTIGSYASPATTSVTGTLPIRNDSHTYNNPFNMWVVRAVSNTCTNACNLQDGACLAAYQDDGGPAFPFKSCTDTTTNRECLCAGRR